MSPFDELHTLESVRGRRQKMAILKTFSDDAFQLLVYGTDKELLFGVKKVSYSPRGVANQSYTEEDTAKMFLSILTEFLAGVQCVSDLREQLEHLFARSTDQSAEWMGRVLVNKMRVGVKAKAINEVRPGTIVEFQKRLCGTYKFDDGKTLKGVWYAQSKLDGMRCYILIKPDGFWQTFSRSGKMVPGAAAAAMELTAAMMGRMGASGISPEGVVFDGEMLDTNRQLSIGNARASGRISPTLKYHIWDVLSAENWQTTTIATDLIALGCKGWKDPDRYTYVDRRTDLEALFSLGMPDSVVLVDKGECLSDPGPEEIAEAMGRAIEAGHEGLILKKSNSVHSMCRAKDWLKAKKFFDAEFPIVGMCEGQGRLKGMLGHVILNVKGKDVGCGSGFSDKDRKWFWSKKEEFLQRAVDGNPVMIRTAFQGSTPDGSLDFPTYMDIREPE